MSMADLFFAVGALVCGPVVVIAMLVIFGVEHDRMVRK